MGATEDFLAEMQRRRKQQLSAIQQLFQNQSTEQSPQMASAKAGSSQVMGLLKGGMPSMFANGFGGGVASAPALAQSYSIPATGAGLPGLGLSAPAAGIGPASSLSYSIPAAAGAAGAGSAAGTGLAAAQAAPSAGVLSTLGSGLAGGAAAVGEGIMSGISALLALL